MYLKIHCGRCGWDFELYHRMKQNGLARRCPVCNGRIPDRAWEAVEKAFDATEEACQALLEAAPELGSGMTVDYLDNTYYKQEGDRT